MPQLKPSYFWEATTKLEISNIALSVGYREEKEGNRTIRVFTPEWLEDGKILWNPSQRLKGWLKSQGGTIRASARELIAQGVKVHNVPFTPFVIIGESKDLVGWDSFAEKELYRPPDSLLYPKRDIIKIREGGKVSSRFSFWYLLPKPVELDLKISCFARNISPESIEDLMKKLGQIVGLGDRHSSGENGLFTVKAFKAESERLNF